MKLLTPYILVFALLIVSHLAKAQDTRIQGIVVDSTDQTLPGATIMLLQATDSVLVHFAITEPNGQFKLPPTAPGNYLLQSTYVGYQNQYLPIQLNGKQDVLRLPRIQLKPAIAELDQVLVEAERIPIQIQNDTIVYDAKAFSTSPNAAVEALLKKMPGMEVDRDGNIRAQGETVDKVLVDGKEFFGNDPKIATKNLPADAIDKVQVYDKKSDKAEFSGIDDGVRQKTINLELKEDKKNGYFGKMTAGYGTDDRYEAKGNLNHFSEKMQLSGIGMLNNVNEQGFSVRDYIDFMGGLQSLLGGGGGVLRLSFDENDMSLPINFGGQNGITNTGALGLNFNYDFSKNTKLSSSYFFSRMDNVLDRTALRENITAEFGFLSEELSRQQTINNNHRLNLNLDHVIDTTQNIKFKSFIGWNNNTMTQMNQTATFLDQNLENEQIQQYDSEGNRLNFNANAIYRKKLGKNGRTLVAAATLAGNTSQGTGLLDALNRFGESQTDTLLQQQISDQDQFDYEGELAYTEPIGKGQYLELSYRHKNYDNEAIKNFFDQRRLPATFLPALSNQFQRDYLYHLAKVNYQRNRKNSNWNVSLGLQQSQLKGQVLSQESSIDRSFLFLLPGASWNYNFSTSKNIRINYRTNIQEPSVQQLQPVVDNSNPLNVYIGNPELKPSFQHSLNVNFMVFDQFTYTNFFTFLDVSYTQDPIINARSVDELFRQTIQPINVKDAWRINNYANFGTPLRFIKSKINIKTDINYNRGIARINDLDNNTERIIGSLDLSLENRKKEMIDIALGSKWTYNTTSYSINSDLDRQFTNQQYYADFVLKLKGDWEISTSMDYMIYDNDGFNDRQEVPIWKAYIAKTFLKNQRGQLKLSAFDILNQNIGVNRIADNNFVLDERFAALGRYVMLSFTYSLSGLGEQQSGFQVTTRR